MKPQLKAVIIGSGIAGIATAVRLAVQGFEVTVYESNNYPGGKLSDFQLNGFHFDTGPSLFVQPQNIEELFQFADENIQEYFEYISVPITAKYFYEDGIAITAWGDAEKFAKELSVKIGENPDKVKQYLYQSKKLYESVGTVFLSRSLHKQKTFFSSAIVKAFNAVSWKYLFKTLNELNVASFTKSHTVQLFNRYATYNGSNPFKASAMLSLIPHLEFNEGVFYPKGGMISITQALYKLAIEKGVRFQFNTTVQRIIYHGEEVKGIVVNNENIYANVVVSNADVYSTHKYLLRDETKAAKLLKSDRSSSAIIFYWGINKEFQQLELHNVFFSKNYKAEFDNIFNYKRLYNDPTIYINVTSKRDPSHAPAGKENWFVMVNAPINVGQNWNGLKQQCKENIFEKLNRMLQTKIEPLIEAEETLDPVSLENKTGSFMGAIYGASSNKVKAAFLRHPNFSKHVHGLYFAGGTVHPGGGIPLCLKSAKIVSELIQHDTEHPKH